MSLVRTPYIIPHMEQSNLRDVYVGTGSIIPIECMHIRLAKSKNKTAIIFTHPIGSGAFLPLVTALAQSGHDVIYCNPRYRGNDSSLIMEKCVADLGISIEHAKRELGYENIILGGWSGGGSLSLFYQDQAENPTLTHTPAGDLYDLTKKSLPKADGIMLLAAHVSRAVTLTEWMDPSIRDESMPFHRDPELNIYDKRNPNQPPYDDVFIAHYKGEQIARNRRITTWVKQTLEDFKASGMPYRELAFNVHGTMASPCWTDPNQDPSDRKPYLCYMGDPKTANDGPIGLARFSTLRSWLSQWSYDDTNSDGLGNASRVTCPVLVINNTADLACTPSHARRLFDAIQHDKKSYHDIVGADHYYLERMDLIPDAVNICSNWMETYKLNG